MITENAEENKLTTPERVTERRILGMSLRNQNDNQSFRKMSGVKDIIATTTESKIN